MDCGIILHYKTRRVFYNPMSARQRPCEKDDTVMALQIRNLTEATGSEVIATVDDLLRPDIAAQVRELLIERGVLVFPQLNIADDDQVRLASLLGTGSFLWHMDGTHDQVPVFRSLLSGRVLSREGGETWFANSYAAYEALPEETKAKIADLRVVHSFATSMRRAGVDRTPETEAHWNAIPDQTHALVWRHKSGRKSLVIGCHASHVVGMDRAESDALLSELFDWTTQDRFTYRHKWAVGDMLIWDNTGVLHRATPYAMDSGRMMHHTTLMGEEAFA